MTKIGHIFPPFENLHRQEVGYELLKGLFLRSITFLVHLVT